MRSSRDLTCLAVVTLVLWALSLASGQEERRAAAALFPEEGFENAVQFWTAIFTRYGEEDFVLHDSVDLRLVYRVVSVSKVNEAGRGAFLTEQKKEMAAILRQIGNSPSRLSPEQARIGQLLRLLDRPVTPALCEELAGRLRYQRGIRERFRDGLTRSFHYMGVIRETLKARGVPEDLAYLPHVESSFAYHAYSKAGAAGIWQLMPAVARPQLRMTSLIDERFDPIKATQTAAGILQTNFQVLGNWPLAITAYNHGRNGIARARAQCGDDLRRIIQSYKSPAFGFASRNFYAEFLAAREIARTPERYFGQGPPGQPLRYRTIRIESPMPLERLLATSGVDRLKLREYNPHLRPRAWTSGVELPVDVEIRLPEAVHLSAAAPDYGTAPAATRTYRVRPGDTLTKIAALTGTSVQLIRKANGLSGDLLRPNQVLRLPSIAEPRQYRVVKGDTLTKIARRFGSSSAGIKAANGLADPHTLVLGQMLLVP